MKFTLDYMDGRYHTRPITGEDVDQLLEQGLDYHVCEVEDAVYQAWEAHLRQDAVFQALFREIDNARRARR